jgi:hypothetical protein
MNALTITITLSVSEQILLHNALQNHQVRGTALGCAALRRDIAQLRDKLRAAEREACGITSSPFELLSK